MMPSTRTHAPRGLWLWLMLGALLAGYSVLISNDGTSNDKQLFATLRQPWELNTADSAALVAVRGIGPAAAARIMRNRYWAGPFDAVDSLQRVQGLRTQGYMSSLRRQLWVHPDTAYRHRLRRLAGAAPQFHVQTDDWYLLAQAGLIPGWTAASLTERRTRAGTIRYPEEVAGRSQRDAAWLRSLRPILAYPPSLPLDLNRATVAELRRVPGLTQSLALRILGYRERLGFYTNANQLNELSGFEPERWQRARTYLYVGPPPPGSVYLPLNTDSISLWSRHPYLTYRHAQALLRKGPYQSVSDWRIVLPDSVWRKVAPYVR